MPNTRLCSSAFVLLEPNKRNATKAAGVKHSKTTDVLNSQGSCFTTVRQYEADVVLVSQLVEVGKS